MPLVVLGLSHHSSPVTVRERFAFAEARMPAALQLLRDSGIADEAVILSTCNRVEIYAATQLEPPRGVRRAAGIPGHLPRLSRPADGRDLHAERAAERPASLQSRLRPGLDGAGRNGNPRPAQEGLRPRAAERPHRRPAQQGLPARVQRRQTHPHGNQHPARQRLGRLGRRRAGGEDLQPARATAT